MSRSRQVWQQATRLVYISPCFDAAIHPDDAGEIVKEMHKIDGGNNWFGYKNFRFKIPLNVFLSQR